MTRVVIKAYIQSDSRSVRVEISTLLYVHFWLGKGEFHICENVGICERTRLTKFAIGANVLKSQIISQTLNNKADLDFCKSLCVQTMQLLAVELLANVDRNGRKLDIRRAMEDKRLT